jgi:hypothetical protein
MGVIDESRSFGVANCRSLTNARITSKLTSTARGELRTVAGMIAPCSVKA